MSAIDIYTIPREKVDVAGLAQQYAHYIQIIAEDAEFLNEDPTRRAQVFAQLYSMDGVKSDCSPEQFVPFGTDPDTYLIPANKCIEQLTPPKTFEDRAKRIHCAFPALPVFMQYKINYGLSDHHDLQTKGCEMMEEHMDKWYKEFPRVKSQTSLTPLRNGLLPTPPPTRPSAVANLVSDDEVEQFLSSPHTLFGKRFVHSAPQDQDDCGTWEVSSYSARMGEKGVEQEYNVLLEAFGGDPVPMREQEVRYLLTYSTVVL